jgi:hypothetical protein
MSLPVNVSEEEAFHLLMDYFTSKHMKIIASNSPSYIRAQFGSWTSLSLDNANGEVEVGIMERNGGSHINLDFSFFKEYLLAWIVAFFGTLFLCVVMWWRVTSDLPRINPAEVGSFLLKINLITFGLSAVMFAIAVGLVGYSTSFTRKRLIEEFNTFAQSLPYKKD